MLQRLLLITLTLCSLTASAQWQQTGSKVRYVNGLGIPTKDTAAGVSADSSQILIRPADSSLYVKYKRTWIKVGGGTVSGTINRVPKFTGATTLGNSSIVDSASAVAMTISPLGRIGIGKSNPSGVLDVKEAETDITSYAYGLDFKNSNVGGFSRATRYYNTNFLSSTAFFGVLGDASTGVTRSYWVIGNTATDTTGYTNTNGVHLLSSGNVGIGYTTPVAKLSVNGTTLINTNTDNGVDKLQVNGSAIASTLKFNTSGQSSSISNKYQAGTSGFNIFIGNGGGSISGTSGDQSSYNVSLGHGALASLTTGLYNFAIGAGALGLNTTGYENVAIGKDALALNTSGNNNTAIGTPSMVFNTTGYKNTAIGYNSFIHNLTGYSNVSIGVLAGIYISGGTANQTSNQSIFIGEDTRASAAGNTNEMVFGHTAIGQGSNTVTLGNSSITKTFLRGNTMVNTTTDNGVDELQVNGSISGIGMKQAYVTKTGAYTATNDDYVIDCTSGTFTVTLPASSGRTGRILIIKNSGAGTITVDGNGAETIDGAATYSLAVQYATVQIMSDGTNWKIIAKF
jgi:hypothetical protein